MVLFKMVSGQLTFEKTYGTIDDDEAYSVALCSDGGYIIAGYTDDFYYGLPDVYVVKTNASGEPLWDGIYHEGYGIFAAYSVIEVATGGFMVLGYFHDGDTSKPWLIRLHIDGDTLWTQKGSGTGYDDVGKSIRQTPDGGYVYCGNTKHFSDSQGYSSKIFVARTDSSGNQLWRREFGASTGVPNAEEIRVTTDNGYIVAAMYDDPGEYTSAWLIKLDESGNQQWSRKYGGASSMESANGVRQMPDGGYILCGSMYPGLIPANGKVYLVRTNQNGDVIWSRTHTFYANSGGSGIDLTEDGGFIITGSVSTSSGYDLFLLRTDSNGDTLWTKRFGGINNDFGYDVLSTPDGGYVACGITKSMGAGATDAYLVKTDENGIVTSSSEVNAKKTNCLVYPNPCSDQIRISSRDALGILILKDCLGRISLPTEIMPGSKETHVDMSHVKPGIYLLEVHQETGLSRIKIIKN